MLKDNTNNCLANERKYKKHVGRRVCKLFDTVGGEEGEMTRYHDNVVGVEYHETYAEWMYKIHYPQDDDTEFVWRDEIEMMWCTCTHIK